MDAITDAIETAKDKVRRVESGDLEMEDIWMLCDAITSLCRAVELLQKGGK